MIGFLVVLPVLDVAHAEACIATWFKGDSAAGFGPESVLMVDNTQCGAGVAFTMGQINLLRTYRDPDGLNLGVSRSWNIGVREVLERGLDYLVLMSTAMRFGPILHTTWVRQMETFWGAHTIEAEGHSWHLIAFHRRVFETIGLFDPAFYPGYFEAIDFGRRMELAGFGPPWPKVWVNALSASVAAHVDPRSGRVQVAAPAGPLLELYRKKWNGDKGAETFTLPFGDKPLDWYEEEPIPVLAERYGLGTRGEPGAWW